MTRSKLRKRLEQSFGKVPDPHYYSGDMEYIRAYSDYRRGTDCGTAYIDDITWHDLDMDRLYRRINPALSTSGEQYLYYMLRNPCTDGNSYARRRELIGLMGEEPSLRLDLQLILAKLGCTRRADLCTAFSPSAHGAARLCVYLILCLLVPISLALFAFAGGNFGLLFMIAAAFNVLIHEVCIKRVRTDFDTVNYSAAMVSALSRIRKLHSSRLDAYMSGPYSCLDRLRSVVHVGGVSSSGDSTGLGEVLTHILLLDLIAYEFLKIKLWQRHEDVFAVHEALGELDAAIAVASYRKSAGTWCEPELDFSSGSSFMQAGSVVHPLLENAVANSIDAHGPMLVTGSNASGKSTFLKSCALCALMAQSICTCPAGNYRASAFRILSSMALSDDLFSGESYYIVETRSIKRILDISGGAPVFCVIDEVLRGTNTVERIAASCEILSALAQKGALCIAATHDIELCSLLSDSYEMYHFEESIDGESVFFDYRLRRGKAMTRNAINLLHMLGFDNSIVSGAHERANRYLENGVWQ